MCVSAIGGKFRTGIQFFLLYRNEVSYKVKRITARGELFSGGNLLENMQTKNLPQD